MKTTVKFFDVTSSRTKHDGTKVFVTIGRAWPKEKGAISVQLNALPLQPWDGGLVLFPHTEARAETRPERKDEPAAPARAEDDEDISF
jgi:hypothetical protein